MPSVRPSSSLKTRFRARRRWHGVAGAALVPLLALGVVATPASAAPGGASSSGEAGVMYAWGISSPDTSRVPEKYQTTRVTAVAATVSFDLALTEAGSVIAWGSNQRGELDIPSALASTKVTTIAAGGEHALAVTAEGRLVAWGDDYDDESSPPDLFGRKVVAVAAGDKHSLALDATGGLVLFGDDSHGAASIPGRLADQGPFTAIAAGREFNLALTHDGHVIAWGDDSFGQTDVPAALATKTVVAISAGHEWAMALASDGTLVAWGRHDDGEDNVPNPCVGCVAIAAGYYHGLALTSAGSITAWGYGEQFQTYIPDAVRRNFVLAVAPEASGNLVILRQSLRFTADAPPTPAVAGVPYRYRFTAAGRAAVTFAVRSGSLPPGLALAADGTLAGTPTTLGTSTFTVAATDALDPDVESGRHTVTVTAGPPASIVPSSGGGQAAAASAAFAEPLVARVTDAHGFPVTGAAVLFTLPSAAGAPRFTGGSAVATVSTGADGIATSPAVRAGTAAGAFSAVGSVPGTATTASWPLVVDAAAPQVADLAVAVSAPAEVRRGRGVTLHVTATNAGPVAAASVWTSVALPAGWRFSNAGAGVVIGRTVYFSSATLAPGATVSYDVVAVTRRHKGSATVGAVTLSGVLDPRLGDNSTTRRIRLT